MSIEELQAAWNAQADRYIQWEELRLDEIVAFAQQRALIVAAETFEGIHAFNWCCADQYANGFNIGGELRLMAFESSNVVVQATEKHPLPPPSPPQREFQYCLFGGEQETKKSIQNRRDWQMFIKGFRFAHGEPNIPQPGDYV